MEISKRLVLINTASGILAKTLNVSVVLWLHQYLLRRISPEEYSLLPLLMSMIVLLPLVTSILTAGLGRFVLTTYAQGDDRGVTQIVSTMFPLLLAVALVILAGGGTLAWHVDKVLRVPPERLGDARIMMALLVFSAALKPPCTVFSVGFYVQQKFVLYNLISVGNEILRISLLFVLLFGFGTRVLWVVVANVTAELVLTTTMVVMSRRMIPALRFRAQEIQWERARELVSFGGWSFVGHLACRLKETTVLLMLNRFAAPDVAVFSLGILGRRQISLWTDVIAGPLYPVVTGMHALGAKERIRHIYLRGGRLALWMMLIVGLPAAIYAPPIIRLYAGQGYIEAAVVMVFILASLPTTGGTWMIWQVANALGRVREIGLSILATELAVVMVTWGMVHGLGWGATGVALTAGIFGIAYDVLFLWPLGLKLAEVRFGTWVRQTLIPGLTPGCVAGVVWAGLAVWLVPDTWLELALCILSGTICYMAVLLGCCLEPKDRDDLARVLVRMREFRQHRWPVRRHGSKEVSHVY
ncbi:MAG: hypothetical protein FJ280_18315 [Planctomycetes bacterium]|nr:hypothetical protein [Planctomycetota bacterium]